MLSSTIHTGGLPIWLGACRAPLRSARDGTGTPQWTLDAAVARSFPGIYFAPARGGRQTRIQCSCIRDDGNCRQLSLPVAPPGNTASCDACWDTGAGRWSVWSQRSLRSLRSLNGVLSAACAQPLSLCPGERGGDRLGPTGLACPLPPAQWLVRSVRSLKAIWRCCNTAKVVRQGQQNGTAGRWPFHFRCLANLVTAEWGCLEVVGQMQPKTRCSVSTATQSHPCHSLQPSGTVHRGGSTVAVTEDPPMIVTARGHGPWPKGNRKLQIQCPLQRPERCRPIV